MTPTARVMVPVQIVPAMIADGTSIAEPDTARGEVAWVPGGTYAIDDLHTYAGSVYSCVREHTGHTDTPDVDSDAIGPYWLRKGPTNRMAPFDDYAFTRARDTGSISFVLQPGFINGVNVYGIEGVAYAITVRDAPGGAVVASKSGDLYEQAAGLWELLYTELLAVDAVSLDGIPIAPLAEATITITAPTGGAVAIGGIKVGDWRSLTGDGAPWGGVQYGARAERQNYTYRKDNDDGTYSLVPRASARRITCSLVIDPEQAMYADALLGAIANTAVPFEASNLPRYGYLNTLGFVSGSISADTSGTTSIDLQIKGNI